MNRSSLLLLVLFASCSLCKINPTPSASFEIEGGLSDMASNAQYTVYTYDPNEAPTQVFLIDNESFKLIDQTQLSICESFVLALNDSSSFLVLCRNNANIVGPLTIRLYTASSSGLKLEKSRQWPYAEVGPSLIPAGTPTVTSEGNLYLLSTGFENFNQSLLRFNVHTFDMDPFISDIAKASKTGQNIFDFAALPDDSAIILAGAAQENDTFNFYLTSINLHDESSIVQEGNTTYVGMLRSSSSYGYTIDNDYRSGNSLNIQIWNFESFKALESFPLPNGFVYGSTVFASIPSYLFILNYVFSADIVESMLLQYPTTSSTIKPDGLFTMNTNATYFSVGGSNIITVAAAGGNKGILLKYQFD